MKGETMKTALQKMKDLWLSGDKRAALKLAASWPKLGEQRDRIRKGWAACSNPDFYRELGCDPDALFADACQALAERYGLGQEVTS